MSQNVVTVSLNERDPLKQNHAIRELAQRATGFRERITAARTYYVRTDGIDTNTGLVDSAGGAFLTIQKAYDTIAGSIDLGGLTVTIQVGAGTYAAGLSVTQPWTGGGAINLTGDTGTPANVHISTTSSSVGGLTVKSPTPGIFTINGFKITASNTSAINQQGAGTIVFNNITFGTTSQFHLNGSLPGAIIFGGNSDGNGATYIIAGNAAAHILAGGGGFVKTNLATVTLSGTPAFGSFVLSTRLGSIDSEGSTYTGAATGARYSVDTNAIIYTGGAGDGYFPGSTPITFSKSTGGQYL